MSDRRSPRYDARQELLFSALRVIFGVVWAINTALEANHAYIARFLPSITTRIAGQPAMVQAYLRGAIATIRTVGAAHVAMATIGVDAVLTVTLLTGIWLRPASWLGIVYSLLLWSTVGGFGGPFTVGATDPGTAIVYALVFLCVLVVPSDARLRVTGPASTSGTHRGIEVVRVLFGLLWAFDTYWKWQPDFLKNGLSLLPEAQVGQPHWIVVYIGFFISVLGFFGPFVFGIGVALTESAFALSLLLKRAQGILLPLGALYSLVLWTTAEGWGGPYGPGVTGNRGDMLGTTNIYLLVYLYLIVAYLCRKSAQTPKKLAGAS
ncbi:MAG: hypothetical protein ACYDDA_07120 [Acidiferrobacteraceae bacterium]